MVELFESKQHIASTCNTGITTIKEPLPFKANDHLCTHTACGTGHDAKVDGTLFTIDPNIGCQYRFNTLKEASKVGQEIMGNGSWGSKTHCPKIGEKVIFTPS